MDCKFVILDKNLQNNQFKIIVLRVVYKLRIAVIKNDEVLVKS